MRVIYDLMVELLDDLVDDLVIQLDDTKRALRREAIARCWDGAYDASGDLDGSTCWQACEKFVKFRLGKIPRKIKRTGRAWAIHEENVKRGIGVVRLKNSEPFTINGATESTIGCGLVTRESMEPKGLFVMSPDGGSAFIGWTAEHGWQVTGDGVAIIEEPSNGT